ncbi:cytochrome P450 [Fomitopsis serialis]|uniref:cytochrome P450 n=1 Tax=Fomitopsis serialis TaxID=139415 RepID=UPI002007C00F|nr:cytochrome P450 [Neoantrodia serialis]KAH9925317.1 cytochrome P450 [Neoantrodia serialis]
MPYLEAVLKEVHRWNPVLPLALPHHVRREDVYAGFRIPAGSTVIANTWAVLHDPTLYPRPDEVIPERYLDKSDEHPDLNPDPRDFAFGYGRRVCPGRMLAEDTLFIVAASVLASFNISDAVPREGEAIKYGGGMISHPDDFTCTIIPRRDFSEGGRAAIYGAACLLTPSMRADAAGTFGTYLHGLLPTYTLGQGAMFLPLILCLAAFIAYKFSRGVGRLPLPPGPRGIPLLGNALQIPTDRSWLAFAEWAKIYGPVMHLSVIGSSFIVLSSREAIFDLLNKKNLIYSDRPVIPMAGELAGFQDYTALLPYGPQHREGRKLILGVLNTRRAEDLHAIEEAKAVEFVSRLARAPSELQTHIQWLMANSCEDPLVQWVHKALRAFSDITVPGAYLVDVLPFLKYVPQWFPGATFKHVAEDVRRTTIGLQNKLYEVAQEQVQEGKARPSFIVDYLTSNRKRTPEDDEFYRLVSTQFYAGKSGSDTTTSALLSFFLMMAQHPEIQRKAQAEVDAVVSHRLPKCSDRKDLPYLEAVLKEVHRCNPVLPLALPHKVRQEDVYAGYRIPAGSMVFANSWAVLHDPVLYPNPDKVIPERYLDNTDEALNPDPREFAFGYGRRVCPGQTLAEDISL